MFIECIYVLDFGVTFFFFLSQDFGVTFIFIFYIFIIELNNLV